MTHVVSVEFENYGRFKGEHAIELGPSVYGVVAQMVGDERRSNWIGKSSFLNAIPHALFGWHSFKSEDGWISYDMKHGKLVVKTSDGWSYKRERTRGKSTQFHLDGPGGKLSGDAAQIQAAKIIGLDEQDFFATCFFRQKEMSRFVAMDPAPRFKVVVGWLGLERGERCVANAVARLAQAAEWARAVREKIEMQQSAVDNGKTLAELADDVEDAAAELKRAKEASGNEARYAAAEEFARVDEEGRRERAKQDELKKTESGGRALLVRQYAALDKRRNEVSGKLKQAQAVAIGEFDGRCPVTDKACPVAAEINEGEGVAARERCAVLRDEQSRLVDELGVARRAAMARKSSRIARLISHWKLRALRERAKALQPDSRWAKAHPRGDVPSVETAAANHAHARAVQAAGITAAETLARLKAERVEAEREVELARAALKAYRGGQRLVAEHGLAQIEQGANALLADAGVDLSVKMAWAREGGGLATQCAECGFPFPPSQKVKACERCQATRGPKLVEKLTVELSDVSGAAEDLGGMATMLSASGWLRARRGAAWGSAFLDEPVGACDGHNRRAVVGYVAGLLRGRLGFEQGFLVAHTRDALDALPGRVTIAGDGKWSKFEV